MAKSKVRVAFIGSGGMARAHSEPLSALKTAEIVAYCDINAALAKEKADTYGGTPFDDAAAMLKAVEPDAAYVCLPPFAHGIELELIKRGIPFFIEKPIGLNLALTKKIAQAVKRKGLITCAGYMNRYRESIQTAAKLMKKDPPFLLVGGWIGGTPRKVTSGIMTWWPDKSKSGGQFLEQVTHTVDIARFLCGDARTVSAVAAQGFNKGTPKNYSNDDAVLVNINFESGAVANLWACCAANGGGGGVSLKAYANKTTALFTGWDHAATIVRKDKEEMKVDGKENIFAVEDEIFINAVRTGNPKKIMSCYGDAARSLAISIAANESLRKGGATVKVAKI